MWFQEGVSSLLLAAMHGHSAVFKTLVDAGADLFIEDNVSIVLMLYVVFSLCIVNFCTLFWIEIGRNMLDVM